MVARCRGFSTILALSVVVLFVVISGGCDSAVVTPPKEGDTTFRSADLSGQSSNGGGLLLSMPTATDELAVGDDGTDEAVREIEEADLVKRIGTTLYILNTYRGFRIIDVADWSAPALRGGVTVVGDPVEMYVVNNVALVVVRNWSSCRLDASGELTPSGDSVLYAIDVSDPNDPTLIDTFSIDGYVAETRRVGDVIYLAGFKQWSWWGDASGAEASEGSFVISVDVSDPESVSLVQQETFTGYADYIHATTDAVFITGQDWRTEKTSIQYVDISDPDGQIVLRGQCEVPGRVLNRFCLDAVDGVLRVVSQSWGRWGGNDEEQWGGGPVVGLFTFDLSDPDQIASLGQLKIIEGETLRAVRFADDVCYAVTFERIDPLWVIDLRDPVDPQITGQLEVPGWSTHLQPDGDLLVAVGIADGSDWRPAVALYDVSDPENPTQLSVVTLGEGYSSSVANYDEKAFKVLTDAKLILVPFDTWDDGSRRNMLQMLDYSTDELVELAAVEHRGTAIRSGIDDTGQVLWVLSQRVLQTLDISDRASPVSLAMLTLAENVLHYQSLGAYGLRLASVDNDYETMQVELQVVDADDPDGAALAAEAFDLYRPALIYVNDELACLVGSVDTGSTRLICIDLTALPSVQVLSDETFEFELADSGWGYGYYYYGGWGVPEGPLMVAKPAATPSIVPPRSEDWLGHQSNPLVLASGHLAFVTYGRRFQATDYGETHLRLVSLADPSNPALAGSVQLSGTDYLQQVFRASVTGDTVYCTVAEAQMPVLFFVNSTPMVRYYLQTVDCSDLDHPAAEQGINVPGIVVQYADNDVYTMDPLWQRDYSLAWRFCSLTIQGDQAVFQKSVDLGDTQPRQVLCRSDLAVIGFGSGWYGIMPVGMDMATTAMVGQDGCNLGNSSIVVMDISDPTTLRIADTYECNADVDLIGLADAWVFTQATWTNQGVFLQIADDKTLTLGQIVDLPGHVWSVAARNGFTTVDLACGFGGVVTVPLTDE